MERPKALLPVAGASLIEWIIAQLRELFPQILVCVSDREKFQFLQGCPLVEDEKPGLGPLMAILSGLRRSANPVNFVVACDIPDIHADFVRRMLNRAAAVDIVVPRYRDGKFEPLFAVYNRAVISAIEKQFAAGDCRISSLYRSCRTEFIAMDGHQGWFRNLNTAKEYHDYLQSRRKSTP